MNVTAYVALGSNLGNREENLRQAIVALTESEGIHLLRQSSLYETTPLGGPPDQENYLNAVVELQTSLDASATLKQLLAIEAKLGRVRTVPNASRTIDLDLLLFGHEIIDAEPDLIVPHPRLHERIFVLDPLCEIAPGAWHPRLKRTIEQLRTDRIGIRPSGATPARELTGLRALVTGSTSGIGHAIATSLAEAGASVIVHGRRSPHRAEHLAESLKRLGVETHWEISDLRDPAQLEALAERAWSRWNGLDVLVNNAGTDTLTGEAIQWSFEKKLEELLAVDVKATTFLSRRLGKQMKTQGGGVIVNLGWDQAETGMEGDSGELFAAVKGAVTCFSRSLALSLAPEVRVHCVAPGWIKTAWGESASDLWQERVRRETPLQRWGMPMDVANAIRWLVSPTASYLTGQTIRVNGGAVR